MIKPKRRAQIFDSMALAEKLKRICRERGLSHRQLCFMATLNENAITLLARGRCETAVNTVMLFAEVLRMPVGELLEGCTFDP